MDNKQSYHLIRACMGFKAGVKKLKTQLSHERRKRREVITYLEKASELNIPENNYIREAIKMLKDIE